MFTLASLFRFENVLYEIYYLECIGVTEHAIVYIYESI